MSENNNKDIIEQRLQQLADRIFSKEWDDLYKMLGNKYGYEFTRKVFGDAKLFKRGENFEKMKSLVLEKTKHDFFIK